MTLATHEQEPVSCGLRVYLTPPEGYPKLDLSR